MSTAPGTPTIDQLNVFVHVVDEGGFAAAARRLGRADSVISYTIANLEALLGVTLFDRTRTRRPQLTVEGRIVLAEARSVVAGIGMLRAKVASLNGGMEGELHVVLDSLLPADRVSDALTAFCREFPAVTLNLHVETLGAVANMVLEGVASIGVAGPYADYPDLSHVSVGSFEMVPVASPEHELARGRASPGVARDHVQLVVYDRSTLTRGRDFSVSANRTWRLGDLSAKHMLLLAGIGWGMMPRAMVTDDLAAGRLVVLDLPDRPAFDYPVDAIYRADSPPGPAATWLIERFREQAAGPNRGAIGSPGASCP